MSDLQRWSEIIRKQVEQSQERQNLLNIEVDKLIKVLDEFDEYWFMWFDNDYLAVRGSKNDKKQGKRQIVIDRVMPIIGIGIKAGVVKQ